MTTKRWTGMLTMLLLAALLASACGSAKEEAPAASAASSEAEETVEESAAEEEAEEPEEEEAEEEDEENYETGDASLDDPRNQDGIGEQELLVVSFGTSFNDSRRLTIGAIEGAIEEAVPDYSVRRGFTAQIVIDHIADRDGEVIDNVTEALDRAIENGVKTLVVQPTHLMNGLEYHDVEAELATYADAFEQVAIGEPLLTSDDDFHRVAEAIVEATASYDDGETAIVFMGHGTEAESNAVYEKMQGILSDAGHEHYYVGTVEAEPSLEDVLEKVQAGSYKKVVLRPLMVVAGDHANNDMADPDDPESWYSQFTAAGYEVESVLEGLGQLPAIQQLYVEHAQAAIATVSGQVASASEMAEVEEVVQDWMVPIAADQLVDGTYDITVDSSSSMFRIEDCTLTVQDGAMTAAMTMGGTGYRYLYMGTGAEAVNASEEDYIPFAEADGVHTFTVPVSALDEGIACAAFSDNKEKWYDRTLVFRSDALPISAFAPGSLKTPADLDLPDGTYQVDVALYGGSGKASVESPAEITLSGDSCTATITWSSPNYDYMLVAGEQYLPVNTEGNSQFVIPVSAFDHPLAVIADTTAMSEAHEISYVLQFDSESIQ